LSYRFHEQTHGAVKTTPPPKSGRGNYAALLSAVRQYQRCIVIDEVFPCLTGRCMRQSIYDGNCNRCQS